MSIISYQKEIESLNRKLITLGEARNQEILDLQHRFAARLRELERQKGFENFEELKKLNEKITELEVTIAEKDKENLELKNENSELREKLKEAGKKQEDTSFLLEKARIDILKLQMEKQETDNQPEIDYQELLKPLEDQLECLKAVIVQKQAEINRLQKLVHEECHERMRLQSLINIKSNYKRI